MPELTFKTEDERRAHPLGGLIPAAIWSYLTPSISEDDQALMQVNIADDVAMNRARQAIDLGDSRFGVQSLILFAVAHPALSDEELLTIAKEKLGFENFQVHEAAIVLGRMALADKTQSGDADMRASSTFQIMATFASKSGNLELLRKAIEGYSKVETEGTKTLLEVIERAAEQGQIEILQYLDQKKLLLWPEKLFLSATKNINTLKWLNEKDKNEFQKSLAAYLNCQKDRYEFEEKYDQNHKSYTICDTEKAKIQFSFLSLIRNDNITILQYLQQQNPPLFEEVFKSSYYRMLAPTLRGYNACNTLMWLLNTYESDGKALANSRDGVKIMATGICYHRTDLMDYIHKHAPEYTWSNLKQLVSYEFFTRDGNLASIEWIYDKYKKEDELEQQIIKNSIFYNVFLRAVDYGQINTLTWLKTHFPDILVNNAYVPHMGINMLVVAISYGHIPTYNWLVENIPEKAQEMKNNFSCTRAFTDAAALGHLNSMNWLREQYPGQIEEMETYNYFSGFNQAHQTKRFHVVQDLLRNDSVFDHAEKHYNEYFQQVNIFADNYIQSLRERQQALTAEQPNAVFNIENAAQARLCAYIARRQIRLCTPAADDNLRFLLSIPAVNHLAAAQLSNDRQRNSLLRVAISAGNENAMQILLSLPAVREAAEADNFYRDAEEVQERGIDLAALARDRESSMTSLTTSEQLRLDKAIKRYQPMLQQAGANNVLKSLHEELALRYESHPAKIMVGGKEIILPLSWQAFNDLNLDAAARQKALEAYFENDNHSAYRYLSKPNPWMHEEASYVYVSDDHTEKWSTFEEYIPLITMLWLAAIDKETPAVDGHTLDGRIEHFINELAHIGRAHNWDQRRIKVNAAGDPEVDDQGNIKTEEYDDKEGDRPSCFSGVKRRLFQSVVGHPLLAILTPDIVAQEVLAFATAHFKKNFTFFHREAFQTAIRHIKEGDNVPFDVYHRLKELDITPSDIDKFTTYMTEKYGDQFQPFKADVIKRFSLPADNDNPSKRLTHFIKLMPDTTPEIYIRTMEARDKPSKTGLFRTTPPADDLKPPSPTDTSHKP